MELIQKEIPMEHETNEKMWIYKDNKELFNKFSQIPIEEIKSKSSILITSIQPKLQSQTKIKKETPLELIIKYTSTTDKMKQEIKNRLIEFIGIPEFAKAWLRDLALKHNLIVTGSSDYHGDGAKDNLLAENTTEPDQLKRILDQASGFESLT